MTVPPNPWNSDVYVISDALRTGAEPQSCVVEDEVEERKSMLRWVPADRLPRPELPATVEVDLDATRQVTPSSPRRRRRRTLRFSGWRLGLARYTWESTRSDEGTNHGQSMVYVLADGGWLLFTPGFPAEYRSADARLPTGVQQGIIAEAVAAAARALPDEVARFNDAQKHEREAAAARVVATGGPLDRYLDDARREEAAEAERRQLRTAQLAEIDELVADFLKRMRAIGNPGVLRLDGAAAWELRGVTSYLSVTGDWLMPLGSGSFNEPFIYRPFNPAEDAAWTMDPVAVAKELARVLAQATTAAS